MAGLIWVGGLPPCWPLGGCFRAEDTEAGCYFHRGAAASLCLQRLGNENRKCISSGGIRSESVGLWSGWLLISKICFPPKHKIHKMQLLEVLELCVWKESPDEPCFLWPPLETDFTEITHRNGSQREPSDVTLRFISHVGHFQYIKCAATWAHCLDRVAPGVSIHSCSCDLTDFLHSPIGSLITL